jgi:DNA (cytosine-5)-methyltransferase 1
VKPRLDSSLTVTDIFCGAGGNTIGAKAAGLKVKVGLNHWHRAIETYGANNPEVEQIERVDVSLCDPRRYHSTDIAIMSPECTTHSPAGGSRHRGSHAPDLFNQSSLDPATMRSRVTMFDVIRFTEFHRYNVVIVENVVEVTRWELYAEWLGMMKGLGYEHRVLSLNSMFFWPTPAVAGPGLHGLLEAREPGTGRSTSARWRPAPSMATSTRSRRGRTAGRSASTRRSTSTPARPAGGT